MTDRSILEDRLSVLEQSLNRVKDPSSWKTRLDLHNVEVEDRIWNRVVMDILREVDRISTQLTVVKNQVSAGNSDPTHWRQYNQIYWASQELFRDSLELFGGLALRDKLLDTEICQLTDELILNCSDGMITTASPTIPAHLELPPRILRRVVRMRFQEWTIWTLPLAAHEFGHIAIEETDELKGYCTEQANRMVQAETAPGSDAPASAERLQHVTRCVKILMADAFATYTLGPAYACPALLLQLDPIANDSGAKFEPSGAQRAELILGILEGMGQSGDDDENAFAIVLKQLRDRWDPICQPDTDAGPVLDPGDVLDIFGKELYDFRPAVRYPIDRTREDTYGGWYVARQWEGYWQSAIKNLTGKLTVPPSVQATSKLRDGLNAAWLCRLRTNPEMLTYIETAAQELCMEIINTRAAPKRGSGRRSANVGSKSKVR